MAGIADPHWLHDAKVRQRHGLAGALLVKHETAIPAVMFSVGECKSGPTSHTDVRIDPCWCCCCREEMR